MTEYFNNALQTTTDINSQDGGANNKFSAAQSVRKDIAKELGKYALQKGSSDNVTIIVVFLD